MYSIKVKRFIFKNLAPRRPNFKILEISAKISFTHRAADWVVGGLSPPGCFKDYGTP